MRLSDIKEEMKFVDKTYWVLFIVLAVVAGLAIFSAGSTLIYKADGSLAQVGRQMGFIFMGIVMAAIIQFLEPKWVVIGGYAMLAFSIICLYIMLLPDNRFVVSYNDAGRWFNLFGIVFQPSESAKLGLVIVVANLLSRARDITQRSKAFYQTLILSAITIFPILVGNLSTAILMVIIVGILWILSNMEWKKIVLTAGISIFAAVAMYFIVDNCYLKQDKELPKLLQRSETWIQRINNKIESCQQDKKDFVLNDRNYQESIAKVAIARGGKSPIGVLPGNSQERDFLPLAYADYIFAIIVEETGIVGAIALIFLYLCILFRACYASSKYEDYNAMLMVMGLALMITIQALISMAVATGIGPVTGQPLPMISRGGTSAIFTSMYFGVMMCVARDQNKIHYQQQQSITYNIE